MATADSTTEQQAELIDKLIDDTAAAEAERDDLRAQVTRLQDKYEPANGVLVDEMLELSDDMGGSLLHIRAFAGERLMMALVPIHFDPAVHRRNCRWFEEL